MKAAKLEMARRLLKEHQEKKQSPVDKNNTAIVTNATATSVLDNDSEVTCDRNESDHISDGCIAQDDNIDKYNAQGPIVNNVNQTHEYHQRLEQQLKAMEIITINKRELEIQVHDLQQKNSQIEIKYMESIRNCDHFKQHIKSLENELKALKENNNSVSNELLYKNNVMEKQNDLIKSLTDKNNNLSEQMDITKTALIAKGAENASLQSMLTNIQNKLDVTELNLQQLSNGVIVSTDSNSLDDNIIEKNELLSQKVSYLEKQLKSVHNEKSQYKVHYDYCAAQLNEQLRSLSSKISELQRDNETLSNREINLIEQIGDMEKHMQKLRQTNVSIDTSQPENQTNADAEKLQQSYTQVKLQLEQLQKKYEKAQQLLSESKASQEQAVERTEVAQIVNISKLNADITSDKVAAQRATAQNRLLKTEIDDLKEVYVKLSQDKLELTEKLVAEKYLNRELTIKLSETEAKVKDINAKLMAKDEEMIRLLSSYNDLEKQLSEHTSKSNLTDKEKAAVENINNDITKLTNSDAANVDEIHSVSEDCALLDIHKMSSIITEETNNALNISIQEAMLRLQDKFLRNMKEVADLSDEKHRLEHIIMQLQSETDTICEYVALYQQQRGILKKREEERKEQLKIFEMERDRMKSQLDHLSQIMSRFAVDKELQQYFQREPRQNEVSTIINLVNNMKTNHLVDPNKQCLDHDSFYPCSCCSGNVTIV